MTAITDQQREQEAHKNKHQQEEAQSNALAMAMMNSFMADSHPMDSTFTLDANSGCGNSSTSQDSGNCTDTSSN